MSETKPLDADTIRKYEAEYVLTPWTAQKGLNPFVAAKGEGCWIHSAEGKKVLDFTSQFIFANLGHCDTRVSQAIARQAALLPSVNSQWATEPKAVLGKLLADITPGDLKKSFVSTGGTEANEGAIKIAAGPPASRGVSRWRYHGSTMGAMAVSADYRNWCAEPSVPGAVHILPPYCYRCHFGGTYPSCDIQCAKHVEDVIRLEGGARRVAALIGEPIFGAGGVIVPPEEYWPMVRAICDKYEVVLIAEEIMTAFGRTGKWFGMDHWNVVPDIVTMAKGINSGWCRSARPRSALDRREVRDHALPARAHLLGARAVDGGGRGDDRGLPSGRPHRAGRPDGRLPDGQDERAPGQHPLHRRSARQGAFLRIETSRTEDRGADPRSGHGAAAAGHLEDEFLGNACRRGSTLWPAGRP